MTDTRQLSPPLKWHGGKHYLADWIIGQMPPHIHYVEPFAGGLAVLLRKPFDGVSEVVNDLDGELTNFWRVLQEPRLFPLFIRRLEATPFAVDEFRQAAKPAGDQVERACRFFVRCRQSRQGLRKDFATLSRNRTRRGMNEQASAWWTAVDGLEYVYLRLRRVAILNGNACDVICQQDGPRTLFYCDPPYVHETRVTSGDYQYEMTSDDHSELLYTLSKIRGRFLLSGYSCEMYDQHARRHGWQRVERSIDCKASSKSKKAMRTECVWKNFND